MKIYTKTGDTGTTGLYGGQRVTKSSPRITAYGEIDELNAVVGVVCAMTTHAPIRESLSQVQAALFTVGAQLASPKADPKIEIITSAHVDFLERQIDVMTQTLPPLRTFILPGGGKTASFLHLARTVCRRAERSMVELMSLDDEPVDGWLLIYINRLSDFLFTVARLANHLESIDDIPWKPRQRPG
jgi:cob(I)alamin adenosyltransferase